MLRTWPRITIPLKQLFTDVVPRRKVARLTTRFYTFPPYILLKRRQGTRQFYPTKFIKWVPKPGPTQFYCTYKYRLELFTKYCHWKAVCEGSLWTWRSITIFKNADPGPFYHYFFLLSFAHSHFDYLNIFTCTSAVIGYPLPRYILTRLKLAEAKYARLRPQKSR